MHRELAKSGRVVLPKMLDASMTSELRNIFQRRAENVMRALGDRPIGIGSREGFNEVVQRSPGRFDIPTRDADFVPLWGALGTVSPQVPWREEGGNLALTLTLKPTLTLTRSGTVLGLRCRGLVQRLCLCPTGFPRAAMAHRLSPRTGRTRSASCSECAGRAGGHPGGSRWCPWFQT